MYAQLKPWRRAMVRRAYGTPVWPKAFSMATIGTPGTPFSRRVEREIMLKHKHAYRDELFASLHNDGSRLFSNRQVLALVKLSDNLPA